MTDNVIEFPDRLKGNGAREAVADILQRLPGRDPALMTDTDFLLGMLWKLGFKAVPIGGNDQAVAVLTGAEVHAEIVRQMRALNEDDDVIGFYEIKIGRDDFWAYQTTLEDRGDLPVMRRRTFEHGAHYFGTRFQISDQSAQANIEVVPTRRLK